MAAEMVSGMPSEMESALVYKMSLMCIELCKIHCRADTSRGSRHNRWHSSGTTAMSQQRQTLPCTADILAILVAVMVAVTVAEVRASPSPWHRSL